MSMQAVPRNAYTDAPELHSNLILGSLQLLFWLFFHPSAWHNYVACIDPSLRPDFTLVELSPELWRSPVLRRLLVLGYSIWPLLLGLTVGLVLLSHGASVEDIIGPVMYVLAVDLTIGIIVGVMVSTAAGAVGGVITGLAVGVVGSLTVDVTETIAVSIASSVAIGIMAGVAGSTATRKTAQSVTRQLAGTTIETAQSVTRQLAGTTIGILIGAVVVTIVSRGASGVLGDKLASLLQSTLGSIVGGILFGVSFGISFALPYILGRYIGGPWAGATAGALGGGGRRIAQDIIVWNNIALLPTLPLNLVSTLPGLTLAWWRPAVLYPFLLAWNSLLFRIDERRVGNRPNLLRWHSAFWDEYQRLHLLGLDDHLILILEHNPAEGQAAMEYLASSRQRWAAQAAQIELDARRLERCADVKAISEAHHSLAVGELASVPQPDIYTAYETGLGQLLRRLGQDHPRYSQALVYQQRLLENISQSRRYGDIVTLQAERSEIIAGLNALALSQLGTSFNELVIGLSMRTAEQGPSERPHELEDPFSALLRSFRRISRDVDAALLQESTYNQRLALSAVEDRLDGLLLELMRSDERYAIRFRPIAARWRQIVADHVRELAEEAELRQEIDNPYIIGVPLTAQQEIFVGRTDVSARIEQLLLDRRRPPVFLHGQRRMGKTSLLNNLGRLLPSTIVPFFVDLQGPASRASDHAGFLYNVARGMVDSAARQRDLALPPLPREVLAADPFTRFDEWLDAVEETLGKNTALLTLDEFEALDSAIAKRCFDEEAVLGMLRYLIQHRPRFKVLLAGSHTLEELQRWASYLINVQVVQVSYLKEDEARQLVERPVKDFALRYEPEASQRVLDLTRGHPALVQLLCSEIVALKNEQPPAIRRLAHLDDVEAAVPEALSHGRFFFADIEQNQVDETGLALLRFLAAQGEGAVVSREALSQHFPDTLEHAVGQLTRREVIEPIDDGYRFQVELIRRWFAQ
jgi:hypothetical protein